MHLCLGSNAFLHTLNLPYTLEKRICIHTCTYIHAYRAKNKERTKEDKNRPNTFENMCIWVHMYLQAEYIVIHRKKYTESNLSSHIINSNGIFTDTKTGIKQNFSDLSHVLINVCTHIQNTYLYIQKSYGYRRRKWTPRHEFKSWTRLSAFHIALIPLGKVWIQLFSL